MSSSRQAADLAVGAVIDDVSKCSGGLRAWADKLDKRTATLSSTMVDFEELRLHAEQLSSDMLRSRPDAPVHRNATDAHKKATVRTAKMLKELMNQLEGVNSELLPPANFLAAFERAEKSVGGSFDLAEQLKLECTECGEAASASGALQVEAVAKEKKQHKEKKRSMSPRRASRSQVVSSAMS